MRAPIRFRHRVRGDSMDPRRRRPGPIRSILLALVAAVLVAPSGSATTPLGGARLASEGGNAVTDWSTITSNVVAAKKFPGIAPIFASIVQVAIYDAVIAIEGGYTPYATDVDAPENSSPEAAAAAAGHDTLVGLFPDLKDSLDAIYTSYLAGIPDGEAKDNGIIVGQQAAAGILELRAGDRREDVLPWVQPPTGPGVYEPESPPPLGLNIRFITPFTLKSASQFRPRGPDPLGSKAYARDFNEVKELGRADSQSRTPQQTEVARFWTDFPLRQWGRTLNALAVAQGLSIGQTARMIAMAVIATADGQIACYDSKYLYLFWRPAPAIARADTDGNPATERDLSWTPLVATPNHPEYPSGHACSSAGLAQALARFFGTQEVPFSVDSAVTHTTHYYQRFGDVVPEIADARVWSGIHFRHATDDGAKIGRKVANWMSDRFFLPAD
jgi:PAP2 superfamily